MKEIKLTKGKVALVDDEDFEELNKFKWYADKIGNTFYAKRRIHFPRKNGIQKGTSIYMHKCIMKASKGKIIDHKDHEGLNNQRYNLRECTRSQNMWNTGSKKIGKKYIGVHFDKSRNKWTSNICTNYKNKHLGRFESEIDAAKAYNEAAKKYHGEFASLNQI